MSAKQNLYTGRSGQLAVMAEFLRRGYNVAVPEIDIGDDMLVIRDADGDLSRIQVKSAIGKGKTRAAGTYKVPLAQLGREHQPELHYVFALHHDGLWREFVLIRRNELMDLRRVQGIGNAIKTDLILYFSFTQGDLLCSQVSLQRYRGNWSRWPEIQH